MNTLNLPNIKETIAQLQQCKAYHEAEAEKAHTALKALQAICQHDMKYITTTPHYRLYKCQHCGKEETD